MQCDRLISLVKNWYLKVQEEAMAPARMVAFMEKHIVQCDECLADPDVKQEVDKIREIVLPPSKVPKPKVVRVPKPEIEAAETTEEAEKTEEEETPVDEGEDEEVDSEEADTEDTEDTEDDEAFDPDIIDEEEV